jgi:hypothetical protein
MCYNVVLASLNRSVYCIFVWYDCQIDFRYTASSELLPLLAAGSLPLLKVDKILQTIDTDSFNVINSVTLSSPFASLSFSASASFEVRSPTRVQVFSWKPS